jgi:hypothetical protein
MSHKEIDEIVESEDISREQAIEKLKQRSEWLQDLENLPPQQHNWHDRGVIISCEGAGHDYHQVSKRR